MEIVTKSFEALSKDELYDILQLRSAVFVVEQDCVYQDIDGKDDKAIHVMGKSNGALVAYTRLFRPNDYFENAAIGRVVVAKTHRGQGLANQLMQASMQHLLNEVNVSIIELSAQEYLKQFYRNLGFVEIGPAYLEDGIPHIKMVYG